MSNMINPKYEGNKVAYLANDFIRYSTALQPLDEFEINFFIYMCYKAKEHVNKETGAGWDDLIDIDMKKFVEGINYKKPWSKYNKAEKDEVYTKLKKLRRKDFEVRTDKYKKIVNDVKNTDIAMYETFGYINHVKYIPETWTMQVRMDKDTQEFLCAFEEGKFTPVVFKNIVSLKSKHAKILYMYFRSFKDGIPQNKGTSYTIEHLKSLLGLDGKYSRWTDLRRNVLLPALKEINEKTDIHVIGKRDVFYTLLNGRTYNELSADEKARISFESMCIKASKGKSVEKIFFHVVDKNVELKEII